jgi:predicted DNA-binding transcriptional regulator AlpA
MEFRFTLRYRYPCSESEFDDFIGRVIEHGCDDALVGNGNAGRLWLQFTRSAATAEEAICHALLQMRRIEPKAVLVEVAPDLVGLTDVALILGLTRQNMRKLMLTHGEQFPPPVHEGSATSVWHLEELLEWLRDRDYHFEDAVLLVARAARLINVTRETLRLPAMPGGQLLTLLH